MSLGSPWDPLAPLPPGVTLVEASAGTGKTYNLTSLVLRLVVEHDVPITRLLVVTYTRAATAELKDRIRARLVDAATALSEDGPPEDPIFAHLWGLGDTEVRRRGVRRLRRAIEEFDQALISTIHGFCQRMLQQNAFESGVAFDLELVPDLEDVLERIVDDFLVRTGYDAGDDLRAFHRGPCGFLRDPLLQLAHAAVADPDLAIVPAAGAATPDGWGPLAAGFLSDWEAGLADDLVRYVDEEVRAAKSGAPSHLKRGQRTFDAAKTRAWTQAIAAWARSGRWHATPPEATTFSLENQRTRLEDPERPLTHPALDAVEPLLRFASDVAGSLRASFVREVRETFAREKARRRAQTYQDLLRDLASRLGDDATPEDREALASAIGGAFDAALVDEFQDTDGAQWTIFRSCFATPRHRLFLIGDPKQAIYGFRGANVHVYTAASEEAGARRYTMTVNWRSDARLLAASNALLDRPALFGPGASFGYVPVSPAPPNAGDGLAPPVPWTDPGAAPLCLRWFDTDLLGPEASRRLVRTHVAGPLAARVAEDVVALLSSGTSIQGRDRTFRPVGAGDVAVLVRTGVQAQQIQAALTRVGVPAVLTGAASVLASDEALAVQQWLAALAAPSGSSAERVAATSPLFGFLADDLLAVDSGEPHAVARWDAWLTRLATWRQRFPRDGFAATFRRALDESAALPRLLSAPDGERRVTNLLHVAELVHEATTAQRTALRALLAWITQRRLEGDLDPEEMELRLDRDAEAVHVLTMHKAKGLEFPICFVPYLWEDAGLRRADRQALVVSDPHRPTRRLLDVYPDLSRSPKREHLARAAQESREEALRLAYVALTRARHRCVVYLGPVDGFGGSPLAAVLHGSGPDRLATAAARVADGDEALERDLAALVASAHAPDGTPGIAVTPCAPPSGLRWTAPTPARPALSARALRRESLDPCWRRHSYSSLVRAAGHGPRGDTDRDREGFDADAVDVSGNDWDTDPGIRAEPEVPLARFPAGAAAGTLLHEIFERLDFAHAHPATAAPATVRAVVTERLAAHGFEAEWADVLVDGLSDALRTPLGGPLGALRLCDVARGERLDELRFDLPLAGGTRHGSPPWASPVSAGAIVEALRARADALPDTWLARLDRLAPIRLAGFLTGSIDLVFRAPTAPDGRLRWFVADYKSNRLDPRGTLRCVPSAFDREGMRREMTRHDYFLQAHLYVLALHRYLAWRLPDHDYDRDIGGCYYLFFRGMLGHDTPRDGDDVHGSCFDRPPREVIAALDAAFGESP